MNYLQLLLPFCQNIFLRAKENKNREKIEIKIEGIRVNNEK